MTCRRSLLTPFKIGFYFDELALERCDQVHHKIQFSSYCLAHTMSAFWLCSCLVLILSLQLIVTTPDKSARPFMQSSEMSLLLLLQALEVELHKPVARSDAARLNALLHDDFREFGRSGGAYDKAEILSRLPAEAQHAVFVADHFEVRSIGESVALLTYRSAHQQADGTLDAFTLRSSVWERTTLGWQMSFHQGTPTGPYELE